MPRAHDQVSRCYAWFSSSSRGRKFNTLSPKHSIEIGRNLSSSSALWRNAGMEFNQPFFNFLGVLTASCLRVIEALPQDFWLDHPSGLPGNSAVPLVSVNGEMNHAFDGAMQATRALRESPYLHQTVASFGEVVARSRLMRLAPGAQVAEHVDFNYHWVSRVRIHVPIVTDPSVIFYCGDESVHMAVGQSWLFDSWRRHRVINASNLSRVHLVIDLRVRLDFGVPCGRQLTQPPSILVTTRSYTQAAHRAVPRGSVMAGEMLAIVEQVLEDCEASAANDPAMMLQYRHLLLDLVHDWREIWVCTGSVSQRFHTTELSWSERLLSWNRTRACW